VLRKFSTLFATRQQRCGLSLSVLHQLVFTHWPLKKAEATKSEMAKAKKTAEIFFKHQHGQKQTTVGVGQ